MVLNIFATLRHIMEWGLKGLWTIFIFMNCCHLKEKNEVFFYTILIFLDVILISYNFSISRYGIDNIYMGDIQWRSYI